MSEREQWFPYLDDRIFVAEQELLKESEEDIAGIPGTWSKDDHVPAPLVDAVIAAESNWNPRAQNPKECAPGANATGLGQFCMRASGDAASSLEVGDYQAAVKTRIGFSDVYDPLTAMEITAFGLGDRYERLKEKTGKDKPKNWYLSVVGFSPLGIDQITDDTTVPEPAKSYIGALRDYVVQEHGAEVDRQIAGESPGYTDCKWYDPICTAKLVLGLGETIKDNPRATAETAIGGVTENTKFMAVGIGAGVVAVLIGVMFMVKHNNPTAIAARAVT
jgi:hypothetical protein